MHDIIIIGGGILGLATAWRLLVKRPHTRLLMLERESDVARHQSGHNSGVLHAGVYYTPGSLKAKLSREGVRRTIAFCEEHDVPYEQCGKLIVASDEREVARMNALEERVKRNRLDYARLSGGELRELEPNVTGEAALLVRATGIVDFPLVCRRFASLIRGAGGEILFAAPVTGIRESNSEVVVESGKGDFAARALIACAGLQADRVARISGLDFGFRVVPFRGQYYRIAQRRGALVSRLIYPVPDPALPFLGIHLTKMIGGFLTVGPNAVLSLGRETYGGNTPVLADIAEMVAYPGFWKLMARYAYAGFYELPGALSKRVYLERCRKYCPSLELADLEPFRPGIRAQNVTRDGRLIDDFLFRETRRALHVCNAPSPAATSCLPIADEIVKRALRKTN